MTTQDLSRKLCEICGIKPIYKVMLDGTLMNITEDKDLAILEFENYIEKIYQEHKAKIKDLKG